MEGVIQHQNPAAEFLRKIAASEATRRKGNHQLITLDDSTKVPEALKKIIDNHILSLPVVSVKTGELVSLVTVQDLIQFLLQSFPEQELLKIHHLGLLEKREKILDVKVVDLEGPHEPVLEAGMGTSLLAIARLMIDRHTHRVVTFDDKNLPVDIITQTNIVSLLAPEMSSFPKAKKTIGELGIGIKDVITVSLTLTVYKTFKIMLRQRVCSVGVTDQYGILRGSISVTDIKQLWYSLLWFDSLGDTVAVYLKSLRLADKQRTVPEDQDPVVCYETDTLERAVEKMLKFKIHRIYIVDKDKRPIGVVSQFDVIKELLKNT